MSVISIPGSIWGKVEDGVDYTRVFTSRGSVESGSQGERMTHCDTILDE